MKQIITWFLLVTTHQTFSQGNVGIGTNNPRATLHVAGTVRIDSIPNVSGNNYKIVAVDSSGGMVWVHRDSLILLDQTTLLPVNMTCQQVSAIGSTTTTSMQSRVSLTLPVGDYMLFAYAEVFNSNVSSGVRVQVNQATTELAYGAPYSDQSTYCPWSTFIPVSHTISTTYHLLWAVWPNGTAYIRRARLCAMKLD